MNALVATFVLTLLWTSVLCVNERDKLFFLQEFSGRDDKTLLVVTWKESQDEISAHCEKFTDRDQIENILSSNDSPIHTLSEDDMRSLLRDCTEFISSRRRPQYDEDTDDSESEIPIADNNGVRTTTETAPRNEGWYFTFPGTKWCGAGSKAYSYHHLGSSQYTDECCRAHDLCNDTLTAGETRNNLTNKSLFTKLSCKCDDAFYNCLDRVNSVTSNTIGNIYFNILKRGCYKEEYPETENCKHTFKGKCMEYERDTNAPKVYQWVPAKRYIGYNEKQRRKYRRKSRHL